MRTILEIPADVTLTDDDFLRILNDRLRQISEGLGASGRGGASPSVVRHVGGGGGGGIVVVSGGTYPVPVIAGVATPDPSMGAIQKIVVTGALTIAAPLGSPVDGNRLTLWIIQDATLGGFQPAWDAVYKLGDYAVINIDLDTFTTIDLFWDTANWYVAGFPLMGQIL